MSKLEDNKADAAVIGDAIDRAIKTIWNASRNAPVRELRATLRTLAELAYDVGAARADGECADRAPDLTG